MTLELKMNVSQVHCATCDSAFLVPTSLVDQRRSDQKSLFCPFGHAVTFPIADQIAALKRTIEQQREDLRKAEEARDHNCRLLEKAMRSQKAMQGYVTRLKRVTSA